MAASSTLSSPSLTSSLRTMHLSAESARHTPVLRMRGGAKKQAPVVGRVVIDEFSHEVTAKDGTKGKATVVVTRDGKMLECTVTNPFPGEKMWLHWGFADRSRGWYSPPEKYLPADTKKIDDKACQSPFTNTLQLTVCEDDAPEAIAFVLKKDSPEEWYSGPTGDFWIAFKPADPNAVGGLIQHSEIATTHWSILDRMRLVGENIKCVAESAGGMSWLYTLLRFNQLKLVPLTRQSNYQSKDLAHTQKGVSMGFAAVYGKCAATRMWTRLCIGLVPRGGGNGDAIRLEILDIMRRHGIKEGHRPGIEDKFIEEWHQKLHTNCAPDDIVIAEAYIKFLETGNADDYWKYLKDGGLTYEYMASIGGGKGSANSGLAGMTATPMHLPQLIGDIKHLRWTLMQVHGGADLDFMIFKAKDGLDADINTMLSEIQNNRNEWWVPAKCLEVRRKLKNLIEVEGGHRDALMLDCAIENWFMTKMTETDKGGLNRDVSGKKAFCLNKEGKSADRDGLIEMLAMNVEHMALSFGRDWGQCKNLIDKLKSMPRWDVEWSRQATAVLDRISLALQAQAEDIYSNVQPKAEEFGKKLGSNEAYITNFAEEVIRGSGGLVLSQILAGLAGPVREAAKMGVWELASSLHAATGEVKVMDDLVGIQGKSFDTPQVLLVHKLGGMEDIPPGVVAILSPSGVDVLSHIAIRARNQKVLLASCHDGGIFSALVDANKAHKYVKVAVDSTMQVSLEPAASAGAGVTGTKAPTSVKLAAADLGPSSSKYVMLDTAFAHGCLGGKSNNLQLLRKPDAKAMLPPDVALPSSVAFPFGVYERVLASPANAVVAAKLQELETALSGDPAKDEGTMQTMRDTIVTQLQAPPELHKELAGACAAVGMPAALTADDEACFDAIKAVWASKWSSRATYSRRACNIPHNALHMAVLCQQVVAGDYAFVLHTTNPVSGDKNEMMGELCVGLGEALVGNYPGRALSFTYNKATKQVAVTGYPSKRQGVFLTEDSLIFRSDSNGEDLEGFAGAGLYDSVIAVEPITTTVDYTNDKLMWDSGFRSALLAKLGAVGAAIETATASAQDIEGVVKGDTVTVLQLRPQID